MDRRQAGVIALLVGGFDLGGGGAGVSKPKRADPVRQRMVQWVPGQKEALAAANGVFYSPARKLEACRWQRQHGQYHETLPLSGDASQCRSPECLCRMSHRQLKDQLGLGTPKQVLTNSNRLAAEVLCRD